jgi:hypothetical protein
VQYLFGDHCVVESSWRLPELPRAAGPHRCALRIEDPRERAQERRDRWHHRWVLSGGSVSIALAYLPGGRILLRFPALADFEIDGRGEVIRPWPQPGCTLETVRHLLLDQVLPRVLALRGQLVVHAGAVRVDDRAIAFLGESGHGKSTLTAGLDLAGFSAISDDGLVVRRRGDRVVAVATYPSLRLWPDALDGVYVARPETAPMAHYSSKLRVANRGTEGAPDEPPLLSALYVLGPPSAELAITPMGPRDAAMAIIAGTFQIDPTDTARVAAIFDAAMDLAAGVRTFSLRYPRRFDLLPEVQRAVIEHASSLT